MITPETRAQWSPHLTAGRAFAGGAVLPVQKQGIYCARQPYDSTQPGIASKDSSSAE
jgi:hypothetical protein